MNVIQFISDKAVIVDDEECDRVRKQFKSIFIKFITIKDVRGYEIIVRKKHILIIEKLIKKRVKNENKKKTTKTEKSDAKSISVSTGSNQPDAEKSI